MKIAITLLMLAVCVPVFGQSIAPPAASEAGTPPAVADREADPTPASAQTVSVSQVRIVRLSQVKGQVELDRKTDQKFDAAFMNLPVVAGAALRTKQGLAEVEFEDNSSLRLTPESQVEFPHLGRSASGATITTVNLLYGSLYVSLAQGKAGGDFTVNADNQTIQLSPSTHMRLDLEGSTAKMTVFQGEATLSGPSGPLVVTKKKAVRFDTASASAAAPEFVRVGEAHQYDAWDKDAVDYHKVRTNALVAGLASSPYSYGLNDLNYYGSFSDIGGCGTMWRPHLANAAFDPYSSGVWSWYPGQGYSWVSLYPWGWAPFHSGSWDYCPAGGGWGWRPQGAWRSLMNHPTMTTLHGPRHGPVRPVPPPAPTRGQSTLIGVNLKALQPSRQGENGEFVFRAGSAGLGVPRGVFNNLSKISQHAETHGSATTFLSERQMQAGFTTLGRSSTTASLSSSSASSASHSSSAHSGSTSTGSSSSFASSHSASSSSSSVGTSMSSGSFSSAAPASSGASASASSGAHH